MANIPPSTKFLDFQGLRQPEAPQLTHYKLMINTACPPSPETADMCHHVWVSLSLKTVLSSLPHVDDVCVGPTCPSVLMEIPELLSALGSLSLHLY